MIPQRCEAGRQRAYYSRDARTLSHDLRYALRALRRSPGFASAAILSLAVGIGANTAIFSLIDAVILKTLPVSHPEELLQVMTGKGAYSGVLQSHLGTFTRSPWRILTDFCLWPLGLQSRGGGEAHSVHGAYLSGQYFETLGVHAVLGRTLSPVGDKRGCSAIAVLSYVYAALSSFDDATTSSRRPIATGVRRVLSALPAIRDGRYSVELNSLDRPPNYF
jgi:hypothetical protein